MARMTSSICQCQLRYPGFACRKRILGCLLHCRFLKRVDMVETLMKQVRYGCWQVEEASTRHGEVAKARRNQAFEVIN